MPMIQHVTGTSVPLLVLDLHNFPGNFSVMLQGSIEYKIIYFDSLAVDVSGDLVASGASDVYEVFLWSVQTGHLLEVISGHEGPVSCLAFNPSPASGASQLATASWDKSVAVYSIDDNPKSPTFFA